MVAPPPPSKKEQLLRLLERGSVFVHLDPRREGVVVPAWLAKKPPLVLQLGFNFPIPIPDLQIDDDGVRCTLSFNRSPFYCILPWSAIYALVSEDGTVTVWPSDLPTELTPLAEPAVYRDAPSTHRKDNNRPRLSVVPPPPPEETTETTSAPAQQVKPSSASSDPSPPATDSTPEPPEGDQPHPPRSPRPPRERPPYLRLVK